MPHLHLATIPTELKSHNIRWHRHGFAWFWRWKKRARKVGRPRVSRELHDLIRRMALENGWGAPRIQAELSKLGFTVSERSVSGYLPRRPTNPDAMKRWLAFLRNHRDVIAGVDLFTLSVRRELLDHVVVISADHLRRLRHEYVAYHHEDRCHLSLGKDTPFGRAVTPRPSPAAKVVALPRVGGIHHRYEWREERAAA